MKKLFTILSVFVLLSLSSCSESETTNTSNENINVSKIAEVLKEQDYDTQKLMYLNLTSDEKFKLWDDKLVKLQGDKRLSLNQRELIKELRGQFDSEVFLEKKYNDKAEVFKNIYVKDFLKKAEVLFDRNFIRDNFYNISTNRLGNSETMSCSCNVGATFTCTYNIDCRSLQVCNSSSNGCGFLGVFECNGNCDVLHPNS